LLALSGVPRAFGAAALLYDNTAVDTFNTLFYSVGPYDGIGDQVQLAAPGHAAAARLQLFNLGAAGNFDVELRLYEAGVPVGPQLGSFSQAGVASAGLDIIDVVFDLGGLALPQDVVFVAAVQAGGGMDLGLNLFQPPTVGLSDSTFLIVDTGTIAPAVSSNENVYFQITAVPEPSTLSLLVMGVAIGGVLRRRRQLQSGIAQRPG
jgi:hypothetical protein